MDMKEQLSLSFGAMAKNKEDLYRASERSLACQEALKKAEAAIINSHDPKELGGNEAARTAKIREMTANERMDLEASEKEKRAAQYRYEIDSLAADCLKWQIRADLAAKGMVI